MIVSALITKLRREYSDFPEKHRDIRTGDGSSTVYRLSKAPVLESSHSLYVNNALQDASAFTLDQDTGDLDLVAATSNEIRSQYKSVNFRDQHWLEGIQDAFDCLGDKFYKMTIRSITGITLAKGVQVYDCPSDCIRLTEFLQSDDYTSAGNWVKPRINTRYDRRSNKLILGVKPSKANFTKISYARILTRPTATSSTLDLESYWIKMASHKAGAYYLRSMATRIAQQGNATIEEGHLSISHLRQLANDKEILFENAKKELKPIMPHSEIPFYIHGGGDA